MNIDTLGIQAFIAIADHSSFQKAAAALHVSQTALTRRLQNLEASLGVRLLERTTRSVALTHIGRTFLPQAKRLVGDLSTALAEIRETGKARRGDVCIACVPTVGIQLLPRIVQEYSSRYPHNRVRILDQLSSEVAAAVLRREAELGINVAESQHPELEATTLLQDQFALICRDDHPLAKPRTLQWRQLESHRLILAEQVSANRSLLDSALRRQNLSLRPFYEVQRSSTAIGLVTEGIAAAIVPRLAIQKGSHPRIRIVPLTDPIVSRTLVLVTRKTATLSPAAQALCDLIRKRAVAVA
jgi:DNA-binding transcriptional LysR family regulator